MSYDKVAHINLVVYIQKGEISWKEKSADNFGFPAERLSEKTKTINDRLLKKL